MHIHKTNDVFIQCAHTDKTVILEHYLLNFRLFDDPTANKNNLPHNYITS